jgi:hypothetical protein
VKYGPAVFKFKFSYFSPFLAYLLLLIVIIASIYFDTREAFMDIQRTIALAIFIIASVLLWDSGKGTTPRRPRAKHNHTSASAVERDTDTDVAAHPNAIGGDPIRSSATSKHILPFWSTDPSPD